MCDEATGALTGAVTFDTQPALFGSRTLADGPARGREAKTSLELAAERYLDPRVRARGGRRALRRARRDDPAPRARDGARRVPGIDHAADAAGPTPGAATHDKRHRPSGRDVRDARHLRALATASTPAARCTSSRCCSARSKAPATSARARRIPKPIPPRQLPANQRAAPEHAAARGRRSAFRTRPEDLAIDADGRPLRIDNAYSWEAPLAAHGLMHMVIANAVAGDPYPIDTLMLFMANMAWNSAMNTSGTRDMLRAKDERGEYRIPFVVVADAFAVGDGRRSPISCCPTPPTSSATTRSACSTGRSPSPTRRPTRSASPSCAPDRDVRAVAGRAGRPRRPARLPGVHAVRRHGRSSRTTADFIVRYERAPGIGFLAGWRGADGSKSFVGEPNPEAVGGLREARGVLRLPPARGAPRGTASPTAATSSSRSGRASSARSRPITLQLWSEPLQKFRLAGQGLYAGRSRAIPWTRSGSRPTSTRCRSGTRRSKAQRSDARRVPAVRDHAAADGDVPLVGLAERVAAPDPSPRTRCT